MCQQLASLLFYLGYIYSYLLVCFYFLMGIISEPFHVYICVATPITDSFVIGWVMTSNFVIVVEFDTLLILLFLIWLNFILFWEWTVYPLIT